MNWRRRFSLSSRLANADSRRSSIALSAMPRRPTSVRGSADSTRCERSPPAIDAAVWPMRSSGQQADAHDRPRGEAEREQHAGDHEPLDEQQPVQVLVDLAQRDRHDGDVAGVGVLLGVDAVAGVGRRRP